MAGEADIARSNTATLLEKCDVLLDLLRAYPDWSNLRRLSDDIEALRDQLRADLAAIEVAAGP